MRIICGLEVGFVQHFKESKALLLQSFGKTVDFAQQQLVAYK
jgi:hypothetical protein